MTVPEWAPLRHRLRRSSISHPDPKSADTRTKDMESGNRMALRRLSGLVSYVRQFANEPVRRFRALWLIVGVVTDLVLLVLGGSYALESRRISPDGPLARIVDSVPYGFTLHGWVLATLGVLNLWGVAATSQRYTARNWRLLRWSSIGILFYSCWSIAAYAGGVWLLHVQCSKSIWCYLLTAALGTAMVMLRPPLGQPGVPTTTQQLADYYRALVLNEQLTRDADGSACGPGRA